MIYALFFLFVLCFGSCGCAAWILRRAHQAATVATRRNETTAKLVTYYRDEWVKARALNVRQRVALADFQRRLASLETQHVQK